MMLRRMYPIGLNSCSRRATFRPLKTREPRPYFPPTESISGYLHSVYHCSQDKSVLSLRSELWQIRVEEERLLCKSFPSYSPVFWPDEVLPSLLPPPGSRADEKVDFCSSPHHEGRQYKGHDVQGSSGIWYVVPAPLFRHFRSPLCNVFSSFHPPP